MASFTLKLTMPAIPTMPTAGLVERIRQRFIHDAGVLVLDAIRNHLGSSSIYALTPDYAARKPLLPQFRRESGKSADQPLILSGEMYDNLTVIPSGDGFLVQVEDGHAVSADGFDYAEWWEEIVSYLELGLHDVEDALPDVLLDIIVDEMQL